MTEPYMFTLYERAQAHRRHADTLKDEGHHAKQRGYLDEAREAWFHAEERVKDALAIEAELNANA